MQEFTKNNPLRVGAQHEWLETPPAGINQEKGGKAGKDTRITVPKTTS